MVEIRAETGALRRPYYSLSEGNKFVARLLESKLRIGL